MNTDEHPCTGPAPQLIPEGDLLRCGSCGATQFLNPDSDNIVWMRAGRVISAPIDLENAKKRHDERYGTNHASS